MGVDNSTLLRQTSQDIINGLRKEQGAFADLVCTNLVRKSIKGSEPYRASKDTLARDGGRQAIGTPPLEVDFAMSSLDWDMGRYSKKFSLDMAEIDDLSQYMDPLTEYLRTVKDHVEVAIDNDLKALLVNASFNASHAAAGGNWSAESSTPVLDMQEAKRTDCPEADMAIVGLKTAQELARHPEFKEAISNYSGGGAISFATLRAGIGQVLNIPENQVYVFGSFYDSANAGQSLTIAYSADELCWIGCKRGLIKLEQPTSGRVSVVEQHEVMATAYSRTLDLQRVDGNLGTYLTGL